MSGTVATIVFLAHLPATARTGFRGKPMSVRILVVDDNPKVRDGARLLLQNHADWEVCGEAADGVDAIEKYRELRPDLLVVDVSMPRLNGLDASLEILKLSPRALILLYTSYLTSQLIEIAHKAGIRGTVSKDAMDLLVVGVETLLRGEEFSGLANSDGSRANLQADLPTNIVEKGIGLRVR